MGRNDVPSPRPVSAGLAKRGVAHDASSRRNGARSSAKRQATNPVRYALRTVDLYVGMVPANPSGVTVSLYSARSNDELPGSRIVTLANPGSVAVGANSFAALAGTVLEPETTYFAVVQHTGSADDVVRLLRTASKDEDFGAAESWSIRDDFAFGGGVPNTRVTGTVVMIRVTGATRRRA